MDVSLTIQEGQIARVEVVTHYHEIADAQLSAYRSARVGGDQQLNSKEGAEISQPGVVERAVALEKMDAALEQDDVLAVELAHNEVSTVADVRRDGEVRDVCIVESARVVYLIR